MSEEVFEISILRAEGFANQSGNIGCYVQIDGRLHDVITPLNADNQESEVLVPFRGLLRLIVKNMGCAAEVLGSVSLDIQILPAEGFQWLPLFTNMAKDQIFSLPEEVEKLKLLILINPKKEENLFQEKPSSQQVAFTNNFEKTQNKKNDAKPEKNIDCKLESNLSKTLEKKTETSQVKLLDSNFGKNLEKNLSKILNKSLDKNLEKNFSKSFDRNFEKFDKSYEKNLEKFTFDPNLDKKPEFKKIEKPVTFDQPRVEKSIEVSPKPTLESLTLENEKLRKNLQRHKILFEDVSKELKAAKLIANEERRARNEVQEKLEKIFEELDENLKRAKSREDGLLKMLQEKDEDLADQTRLISQLKVNLRNLEHEKMQIMDVIGENKTELTLTNFERLSKELVLVKALLEESESQRHKLQALIQEMPETPSKLSNFLSPISLKSLEIDASDDVGDHKELGSILEDLGSKYKMCSTGIPEKQRIPIFRESDLNIKNPNSFDSFSQDLKNHRRRATTGFIKVYKENSRK